MAARPTLTSISKKLDSIEDIKEELVKMTTQVEISNERLLKAEESYEKLSKEHSEICLKLGNHTIEHKDILVYIENSEPVFNAINMVVDAFEGLSTFIRLLKKMSIWVLGPGIAAYIIYHLFFNQTMAKLLALINTVQP